MYVCTFIYTATNAIILFFAHNMLPSSQRCKLRICVTAVYLMAVTISLPMRSFAADNDPKLSTKHSHTTMTLQIVFFYSKL